MGDATYPLFSVFSFIGFLLVLIPLPWHLRAWNSGTCLYITWTAAGCLILFINSIVWHRNAIDWAPIWCDISTRLLVGVSVAIPAASLCLNRRLYKIASSRTASTSYADKRRVILTDLAIGLGIPFLQMPLQFIVQGHRYDIFEDIGCYPTTVNTPAAYPLTFLWPNVISAISAIYCILTIHAFMQHRVQFAQFISSNSSLSISRYFRLMSLATSELFLSVPITSYGLYLNITSRPIYPWKSWSDIHYKWYIIDTYPAILWRSQKTQVVILELSRWSVVICAFVFFAFFGFADEARRNYKRAFDFILGMTKFGSSAKKWTESHPTASMSVKGYHSSENVAPTCAPKPIAHAFEPTAYDIEQDVLCIDSYRQIDSPTVSWSHSPTDSEGTVGLSPIPTPYRSSYSVETPNPPKRPMSFPH